MLFLDLVWPSCLICGFLLSSMFVSDRRFILKTCGRIQLLSTVEKVIQLAMAMGLGDVGNVSNLQ